MGATVEMFKAAEQLRAKAPLSDRIADVSIRLFIAAVALASGLIALSFAAALFGWSLSIISKSLSLQ